MKKTARVADPRTHDRKSQQQANKGEDLHAQRAEEVKVEMFARNAWKQHVEATRGGTVLQVSKPTTFERRT